MLSQLTMNETEEQMFTQYCDGHSGLTREIGQEFLIMYYVNRSRFMEAIRMHRKRLVVEREKDEAEQFHRDAINRRNSRQLGGRQNEGSSSQTTLSRSQRRQTLIDQLMKVLPAPERLILELEKEESSHVTASAGARTALSSHLSFNTGRDVLEDRREGEVKKQKQQKAELASGSKGILLALLDETDAPSTSLKGLDLDWVTRSLTGGERKDDSDDAEMDRANSVSVDDDESVVAANGAHDADKPKVSTVEIMDLDSD